MIGRAWVLPFVWVIACGGQHAGAVAGVCQTSSFPAAGGGPAWSCSSPSADGSQLLPVCPASVQAGSSPCNFVGTIDTTTDPSHPSTVTITGQCFDCGTNGQGTEWKCSSQGWQAGDTFSCAQ